MTDYHRYSDRGLIEAILEKLEDMEQVIEELRATTERIESASQAVVSLLQGLAEQIRQAADDPDQVRELGDRLDVVAQSLADAVVANTPAEGPTDPEPFEDDGA